MRKVKRIKTIEGKTIKEAEYGGGDFEGADNRTVQLTFTDGTSFCIDFQTKACAEGVFYSQPNGPGKKLYKG
jgi:hypothetical protein